MRRKVGPWSKVNRACAGLEMDVALLALNNRLTEVLARTDSTRNIGIAGAGMTLHLPSGEAAPHKMIRSSGSERLQQCEIKLTQEYCCGITACIGINAKLASLRLWLPSGHRRGVRPHASKVGLQKIRSL
jgi:hypothetical protein